MKTSRLIVAVTGGVVACALAIVIGVNIATTPSDPRSDSHAGSIQSLAATPDNDNPPWLGVSSEAPVVYANEDGQLVAKTTGVSADARLADVWGLFRAITGSDAASIIDIAVSDDRVGDTGASVTRDEQDPTRWHVVLNMALTDDWDNFVRTLVHEYGHMVSLDVADVPAVQGSCPTFAVSEGCVSGQSIFGRFLTRFWSDDKAAAVEDNYSKEAALNRFTAAGGINTYVSEYAATNGAEDFAETFAAYILGPETPLTVGSVAQAKVDFLAADTHMTELRTRILAAVKDATPIHVPTAPAR